MDGALETVRMGILSTLQPANVRLRRALRNQEQAVKSELYPLIFDPQTSGGLLASVPAESAGECIKQLIKYGYPASRIIGKVTARTGDIEPVTLVV